MTTGITARDKKLLYILGLIVIAALFFIIGIRPLNRKISAIEEKVDDAQVLHDSIKMKLYQLGMIEEFKESAEKMTKELSSRYYERQVAADVDKLVTNKALGYGLKVNNLSIQSSKEPVALLAYANSEAWALKERAMEAAANAEAEEKDSSTDKKSDKEDKKSDKKDKDSSEDDSKKASEGMVDIETIASINNEEGIYNVEDTTGADVYATTLMLDVYGPHDKAQAMLDEIIANKSFRVLSYQWSESTEFPYEYVDGELVQVVQENSDRLIINFDMYMYDGSAFKALTEGIVNDETTDEDSTEASTDISE